LGVFRPERREGLVLSLGCAAGQHDQKPLNTRLQKKDRVSFNAYDRMAWRSKSKASKGPWGSGCRSQGFRLGYAGRLREGARGRKSGYRERMDEGAYG
jgi:hypothetical protein